MNLKNRPMAALLFEDASRTISQESLQARAPSVFAGGKAGRCSSKYLYIPTISIVERLAERGWLPTSVIEQKVRTEDRKGFQKHMLRFRHFENGVPGLRVGDSFVDMILTNAHDGTSSYVLDAGIYRPICRNGLIVSQAHFGQVRFKHQGFDPKQVIEASYRVIESVPQIGGNVEHMQETKLSFQEQQAFATAAGELRFGDEKTRPDSILKINRSEDQQNDLWTTYNRVQENLIEKGGVSRPPSQWDDENGVTHVRRNSSRAVKGIDENARLNKALWTLAEKMRELKAA